MILFPACSRFRAGFFQRFKLEAILENQGDFIARTNRNNRVVLFSTFDVVIRECFGRRTDSATDPCLTDFT